MRLLSLLSFLNCEINNSDKYFSVVEVTCME